jgi:hypothetical protein
MGPAPKGAGPFLLRDVDPLARGGAREIGSGCEVSGQKTANDAPPVDAEISHL